MTLATALLAAILALVAPRVSAQSPQPTAMSAYCPGMVTVPKNVTGDCSMMCTFECDTQDCTLATTPTGSSTVTCDPPKSITPFCPDSLSNPGPTRTLACNNNETCTYNCLNATHTGTCSLSYSRNNMRWSVDCNPILPNPSTVSTLSTASTTAVTNATTTTTGSNVTVTTTTAGNLTITATVTTTSTPAPTTTGVTTQVPICPQALSSPGPSSSTPCNSNQTCSYTCSSATAFAHCLLSFTTADMQWHVQCGNPTQITSVGATTTATATQEPYKAQICPSNLTIAGNYTPCMASNPCVYSCANSTTTAQCSMSYTADTMEWTVLCNLVSITTTTTAAPTTAPTVQPRAPFCPAPISTPSTATLCSPTSACTFLCYNATHFANCSMTYGESHWSVSCNNIVTVPDGWNSTTSSTAATTTATSSNATTTGGSTSSTASTASTASTSASTSAGSNTASATISGQSTTSGDTTTSSDGSTVTTAANSNSDSSDSTSDSAGTSASGDATTGTDALMDTTETEIAAATTLEATMLIMVVSSLASMI